MPSNLYVNLANFKADLGITGAGQDAIALRLIEDVSRAVDDTTNRTFYSQAGTRYFDSDRVRFWDGGYAYGGGSSRELWPSEDIVSITTLKVDNDGDGAYELTLAQNTDYWLWPDNAGAQGTAQPFRRIDLNPQGTIANLATWPFGRRRIQCVGIFGYSNETEDTGQIVSNNPLAAGGLSLTMPSTAGISQGETLLLESEQVYVSAVANPTTLTIVRAQNGTTAAAHASGIVIYRRRYARPVERATMMQAARLFKRRETAFANTIANTDLGTFQVFRGLDPDVAKMLEQYSDFAAGVA